MKYSIYHHLKFHGCLYTINRLFWNVGTFFCCRSFLDHTFTSFFSVRTEIGLCVVWLQIHHTIPFAIREDKIWKKKKRKQQQPHRRAELYRSFYGRHLKWTMLCNFPIFAEANKKIKLPANESTTGKSKLCGQLPILDKLHFFSLSVLNFRIDFKVAGTRLWILWCVKFHAHTYSKTKSHDNGAITGTSTGTTLPQREMRHH